MRESPTWSSMLEERINSQNLQKPPRCSFTFINFNIFTKLLDLLEDASSPPARRNACPKNPERGEQEGAFLGVKNAKIF